MLFYSTHIANVSFYHKGSFNTNILFCQRSSALENLLNIAGKDWDTNLHVSKTTSTASDFTCPAAEGHYPDPKVCNIYHQCAGGTAHATTCQPGLAWNAVINMCDWEANVDCDINRYLIQGYTLGCLVLTTKNVSSKNLSSPKIMRV